jgi:hypothetical protein
MCMFIPSPIGLGLSTGLLNRRVDQSVSQSVCQSVVCSRSFSRIVVDTSRMSTQRRAVWRTEAYVLLFLVLCCWKTIVRADTLYPTDEAQVNFANVFQPCHKDNSNTAQPFTLPHIASGYFNAEAGLSRIAAKPSYNFEMAVEPLKKKLQPFHSFTEFANHYIKQPQPPPLGNNEERKRHTPHVMFDLNTLQTRLTWCDGDQHLRDEHLWESMRNRRIMFVGDSVTRYQYLDLIHFLSFKSWNQDLKLVDERVDYKNFNDFFQKTNAHFNGKELCECFRSECCESWRLWENRKFYDPALNVTVWYFMWYGDISLPHGHFSIAGDIQPISCMPNRCNREQSPRPWMVGHGAEFVRSFVDAHHPDATVVNTGLHTPFDSMNGELFTKYITAWREQRNNSLPTKLIFKSTTPRQDANGFFSKNDLDKVALGMAGKGLWEYWDIGEILYELFLVYRQIETPYVYYTESAHMRGFQWDNYHFTPWVYQQLNKWFIIKHFADIHHSV